MNQAMQMLNCSVNGLNISSSAGPQTSVYSNTLGNAAMISQTNAVQTVCYGDSQGGTLWQFWQNLYYPYVIKESYPVYIQEKAMDKGKQAFELLKALMDKGLVKVDKVKDFIEAMDTILKTL